MGACYESFSCRADSEQDAIAKCDDHIEQCRWEDGNSAYSGTMATCCGVRMTGRTFSADIDAHDWLDENTDKRGNVLGVKVVPPELLPPEGESKLPVVVNDNSYYVFGAMCGC
jgi:hypothetical protein